MTCIKIFEGFEHKIKWKISHTRIKEGRKNMGENYGEPGRALGRHSQMERPGCYTTHLKVRTQNEKVKDNNKTSH